MGVDIGVCHYIVKREDELQKLSILRQLAGLDGEAADLMYDELWKQCNSEITYEYAQTVPQLHLVKARMHNLSYSIRLNYVEIEFKFYETFFEHKGNNIRVYAPSLLKISNDMRQLVNIIHDQDRIDWFNYRIQFYSYLIENNLMIYSC